MLLELIKLILKPAAEIIQGFIPALNRFHLDQEVALSGSTVSIFVEKNPQCSMAMRTSTSQSFDLKTNECFQQK